MMGFWEPHSSSIDFCETNYLLNDFVVEPHNVWSSFVGITLPGLIGFWQSWGAPGPLGERRVQASHLILALTGIGSMGLHGTLHWFFQSSDELPMIYLLLANLYAIAELDAPPGKPNYPWLEKAMIGVLLVNTAVYYTFQSLYWVFLLTFASGCVGYLNSAIRLVYGKNARKYSRQAVRIGNTGGISFFFFASLSWILDMLLCHHVIGFADNRIPWIFRGATPHVIWHFASGLGGYCAPLFLMAMRCEILGAPYTVNFFLGVVPLVSPVYEKMS